MGRECFPDICNIEKLLYYGVKTFSTKSVAEYIQMSRAQLKSLGIFSPTLADGIDRNYKAEAFLKILKNFTIENFPYFLL